MMTIRFSVAGDVHLDRVERYGAKLHDTGCTLIRNYAAPGKPHTYTYTVTINEGGRHFQRDTFYLQVEPYHRGQTVYSGLASGRVQWFTVQGGHAVVVTSLPPATFQVRLAPDLRSGTVESRNAQVSAAREGLRATMTVSWTCPVLFSEHYG